MKDSKYKPYSTASFTTVPGKSTRFFRKFIPWQIYRFVVLNIKMIRIIVGGHS
jgi:hypothetical protein